ncbi:MAG: hypothetical protein MZW92_40830 [Comamonadaceae bacterium]|nr:hypothetical protein [Comamonadaceae bacterium]
MLERDGADGQPPVVIVKAGLAINAEGEIIGLPKHDVQRRWRAALWRRRPPRLTSTPASGRPPPSTCRTVSASTSW